MAAFQEGNLLQQILCPTRLQGGVSPMVLTARSLPRDPGPVEGWFRGFIRRAHDRRSVGRPDLTEAGLGCVRKHQPTLHSIKPPPSDHAVLACWRFGRGKVTPDNRVLSRFHTVSASFGQHLLSAYGGMGSLNDVVLQRISEGAGVSVPRADNDRFDELRREIYDVAKRRKK